VILRCTKEKFRATQLHAIHCTRSMKFLPEVALLARVRLFRPFDEARLLGKK